MPHPDQKQLLDSRHVMRRFDRAAQDFDSADFVHTVTRDNLFERLQPIVIEAKTVVDLGAATGAATRQLERRFRGARVVSLDLSRRMLATGLGKRRWFSRRSAVQATATALPFADASVDVVFSNLMLPWVDDLDGVFAEVARVLRAGGLFVFATLGPDTLLALKNAWRSVDANAHVSTFPDMHDVGDALVRARLADPVLDVDRLTVSYTSTRSLFRDMGAVGARNSLAGREKSLMGKERFARMVRALQAATDEGKIDIELELVYGHCWGTGTVARDGEFAVDATRIPMRQRNGI
jgi:malonyl-CoA O-methyltransferase